MLMINAINAGWLIMVNILKNKKKENGPLTSVCGHWASLVAGMVVLGQHIVS